MTFLIIQWRLFCIVRWRFPLRQPLTVTKVWTPWALKSRKHSLRKPSAIKKNRTILHCITYVHLQRVSSVQWVHLQHQNNIIDKGQTYENHHIRLHLQLLWHCLWNTTPLMSKHLLMLLQQHQRRGNVHKHFHKMYSGQHSCNKTLPTSQNEPLFLFESGYQPVSRVQEFYTCSIFLQYPLQCSIRYDDQLTQRWAWCNLDDFWLPCPIPALNCQWAG